MHFTVERDVGDDFALIGFVGGAEVVDVNTGELGHEPVGDAGRDAAHDEVVNALFAPAGDDVVAFFELLEELGDLVGVVLEVAVHGEDVFTRGVVKTGGKGGCLAEVAAELDDEYAAIDRGDLFKELIGTVTGSVVDEDQLEGATDLLHDLLEAGVEGSNVFIFVMEGNNNRIFRHN